MTTQKTYTQEQMLAILDQQAKAGQQPGTQPGTQPGGQPAPQGGPVTNFDATTIKAAQDILAAHQAQQAQQGQQGQQPGTQPGADQFDAKAEFEALRAQITALAARPGGQQAPPSSPAAYDPTRADPFLPGMTPDQRAEAVDKWLAANGHKSPVDLGLAVMQGVGT